MWKLTGSCLNIIAKCCSIINYGSIINSSFVNGIIAFFTKIFIIFWEGKNFLSHPQTVKKIAFSPPDHLSFPFSIQGQWSDASDNISDLWHCTKGKGKKNIPVYFAYATKFHHFVFWSFGCWKFWKQHQTSQHK